MKQSNPVTVVTQNISFVPLSATYDNRDQAGVIDLTKVIEIAESLKTHKDNGFKGLLQIPEARQTPDGYELAFGRHRRAAFLLLAETDPFWNEMPLIVREMDDLQMFEALADENFKRRDLNFVEAAEIIRAYVTKYGKTYVEAAAFFGKTEEYIRSTVRFVSLPEKAKDAARRGEINVTTARMVLSAQKVLGADEMETVIEDLANNANGVFDTPQECIQSALEGVTQQISSNAQPWWNETKFPFKYLAPIQRKDVAALLDVQSGDKARKDLLDQIMSLIASGMEIADAPFSAFTPDQLSDVRILANPPTCANCARFAQIDNSKYCGLKLCFDRKTKAWKEAEIVKVSKAVGISLYANKADGGQYVKLTRYQQADKKLFDERHPDLRLLPTKGNETIWNNFEGLPSNLVLIAVGKTARKRIEKESESGRASQGSSDADRKRAEEVQRIHYATEHLKSEFCTRFSYHVATPAFLQVFEGLTNLPFAVYLFESAADAMGWTDVPQGVDDFDAQLSQIKNAKKKSDALRQLQNLFTFLMVDWRVKDYSHLYFGKKKPLIEMAKVFQGMAEAWNVKLPKNFMAQAETYQADFEREAKIIEKGGEG